MCTLCPVCVYPGGLDMKGENVCLKPPGFHQDWCPNGASHPDLSNTFPQDPLSHMQRCRKSSERKWCQLIDWCNFRWQMLMSFLLTFLLFLNPLSKILHDFYNLIYNVFQNTFNTYVCNLFWLFLNIPYFYCWNSVPWWFIQHKKMATTNTFRVKKPIGSYELK